MTDWDPQALIGRVIADRYRLEEVIASGGMGSVYKAWQVHMRKRVAVKLLHPNTKKLPELVQRFERESVVGGHATHPNVARATDFGRDAEGNYYLVQDYIEGIPLKELLEREPLPHDRALYIAREICLGLHAVHELGIVHRDLAPKNVLVSDQTPDRVTVIDFGLSKVPMENFEEEEEEDEDAVQLTSHGTVFGTIGFMAPEAALGMQAVTARSDLYALGVTMYEMLAGKHPFDKSGGPHMLFRSHSLMPIPPFAERAPEVSVPAPVDALVMRLLEKAPEKRYPSAQAVVEAIDAACAELGLTLPAPPSSHASRMPSSASLIVPSGPAAGAPTRGGGKRALMAVGGVLLLAAVMGGTWVVAKGDAASGAADARSGDRTSPNASPPPPPPAAPEASASASASASAGATAPPDGPTEVDGKDFEAWHQVMRSAARFRNAGQATASVEAAATISAARLGEEPVRADVAKALVVIAVAGGERADRVFAMFGSDRLGSTGPDVLYELIGHHPGALATGRAEKLLKDSTVLGRATPALRIALELREAPCPERPGLFARAGAEGDRRALRLLQGMSGPTCQWCCRGGDPALQEAMHAIRGRQ